MRLSFALFGFSLLTLNDSYSIPVVCKISDILDMFVVDENEVIISASIGISIYPLDGATDDILINHADSAMYTAKSRWRPKQEQLRCQTTRPTLCPMMTRPRFLPCPSWTVRR